MHFCGLTLHVTEQAIDVGVGNAFTIHGDQQVTGGQTCHLRGAAGDDLGEAQPAGLHFEARAQTRTDVAGRRIGPVATGIIHIAGGTCPEADTHQGKPLLQGQVLRAIDVLPEKSAQRLAE